MTMTTKIGELHFCTCPPNTTLSYQFVNDLRNLSNVI